MKKTKEQLIKEINNAPIPAKKKSINKNGAEEHLLNKEILMENKKPTKKALIQEIMATPTKTGGEFDVNSLERTNVANLQLILSLLKT